MATITAESLIKPLRGALAVFIEALNTQEYVALMLALAAEPRTEEQQAIVEGCESFVAKLEETMNRK